MTILVTGSSGFVGSQLVTRLQADGYTVRVLDRTRHDLTRPESLEGVCEGVDVVYHLAAYAHINQVDVHRLRDVNIGGTRHLVREAVDAGVARMVYLSSILADPEMDMPRTDYGDSKLQAEELLQQAHNAREIDGVILRPVNVYGPGMKGNLMTLMRLIRRGLLPPLPRFDAVLSLVGVDDLCSALLAAGSVPLADTARSIDTAAPEAPRAEALVLPITDGQQYPIKDLEAAIRQALGKSTPDWAMPASLFYLAALGAEAGSRVLGLRNAPGLRSYRALSQGLVADDSKARQHLRYNPRATFYSELPHIVAGLNARPALPGT